MTDFRALLVRSLLDEMMPKTLKSAYGQGLAGEVFRSHLIDAVSKNIVARDPNFLKLPLKMDAA